MSAPKGFNYLSLPRELRDQVMQYALHPGEVCIPTDKSSRQDQPRYAVQLLATCRQVYKEGHEIWYGRNAFRLRSCSASGMRQILGAYQAKHLGMMPKLVIDCTLHDLPLSRQNKLLNWMIFSTAHGESQCYAKKIFRADWTEALEEEWKAKVEWLRKEVPNGHRMHISLDPSTFDKLWFELERAGMQPDFGFILSVKEVRLGTTITTETEVSLVFQRFRDLLPGQLSGLALTSEYEQCPRNQTLRKSVRLRGGPHKKTVDEQVPNRLPVDALYLP